MKRRRFLMFGAATFSSSVFVSPLSQKNFCVSSWCLPSFLATLPNNISIKVRDTDSALGQYNTPGYYKSLNLEDLVKYHGRLCDGIVLSFFTTFRCTAKTFP